MSKEQQNHGHSIFNNWTYSIVDFAYYSRKPSEAWRDTKTDKQENK